MASIALLPRLIGALGLAMLIGICPVAGAGPVAAAQTPQVADVALTAQLVEAFIKSYPAVKKSADGLAKKYKIHTDTDSAAAKWQAWLGSTAAQAELNGIAGQYGFDSFLGWVNVTINVARAYAFAKEGPNMDSQMSAAIAQIKNNPDIPDAQKKMLLKQMAGAGAAIAENKPSQDNIDAVTPYMDQLATLFK